MPSKGPWKPNYNAIPAEVRRIIKFLGDDTERDGLIDTPARVARAYEELFAGYRYTKEDLVAMLKSFDIEQPANITRSPVEINGIKFNSFCEHHMLPVSGVANIAYTPKDDTVIGLSKVPRVVKLLAARLTIQERLTEEICEVLSHAAEYVRVEIEGSHNCVSIRGVGDENITMKTVAETKNAPALTGAFCSIDCR